MKDQHVHVCCMHAACMYACICSQLYIVLYQIISTLLKKPSHHNDKYSTLVYHFPKNYKKKTYIQWFLLRSYRMEVSMYKVAPLKWFLLSGQFSGSENTLFMRRIEYLLPLLLVVLGMPHQS